eukprot:GEMP01056196.1.p1 GENE.GEMP01056196.1~~GEMP01056196.1.p1  ORF type:complete len:313 (-),score=60.69 GEMP01056196.1:294-1232(-)
MLQCKSRRRILDVKSRKLSDSAKDEALWLLHVLAKRAAERNPDIVGAARCSVVSANMAPMVLREDKLSVSSLPVKINGSNAALTEHGLGVPGLDDVSDSASTAPSTQNGGEERSADGFLPVPTYTDFISQIPDYPEIPGYESREERRMNIIRVVQACYDRQLKASQKEMLAMLRVENLNSFNLRDPKRSSAGWIMYPQASMMNHACYPNTGCTMNGNHLIFETLRDVKEGEELLQSYLGSNSVTDDWGFTCQCDRCRGVVHPDEWEKFVTTFRCECGCITPQVGTDGCHCQDGLLLDPVPDDGAALDVETEE